MRYCQRCIQPDTRPGLFLDNVGICSACRAYEERMSVDWPKRENELLKIAEAAKEKANNYDCVVGVSGGKDSHFQALYAKEKLGLRVLLANCAPDNISEVGRMNLENLVQKGFDMISIRPNPKIERKLSKISFFKYGNFVKPSEYPLWASAYLIALKFNIPLVIQGENAAETLGIEGYLKKGGDALQQMNTPTLAGGNVDEWLDSEIEVKDLFFHQFPNVNDLIDKGVKAIYLSHYAKEWSNTANTQFAVEQGLRGRPNHNPAATGRLNPYFSIDADLKLVNQYIKYLKFGFGAVTDEVCYDIREGRMSREDGIKLVEKYDGRISDYYIQCFCEYIDISIAEVWSNIDQFVNNELFYYDNNTGKWKKQFVVGEG